jgi:hypothetical protein
MVKIRDFSATFFIFSQNHQKPSKMPECAPLVFFKNPFLHILMMMNVFSSMMYTGVFCPEFYLFQMNLFPSISDFKMGVYWAKTK